MASTGIDAVAELTHRHNELDNHASEKSYDEKNGYVKDVETGSSSGGSSEDGEVLNDARDLVTHVISLDDDPELSPWTFRSAIIGLGLSTFGGVLGKTVIWILIIPPYLSTFS